MSWTTKLFLALVVVLAGATAEEAGDAGIHGWNYQAWGMPPSEPADLATVLMYKFSSTKSSLTPEEFTYLVACSLGLEPCPAPAGGGDTTLHNPETWAEGGDVTPYQLLSNCSTNTGLTSLQCDAYTRCLSRTEMLQLAAEAESGAKLLPLGNVGVATLQKLLPLVVAQSQLHDCVGDGRFATTEGPSGPNTQKTTPLEVWGYGFLFVTVISACSLVGVSVLPLIGKEVYQQMLTALIGLAAGSLAASAMFHLLPQAFNLRALYGNHDYLFMSLYVLLGLWAFLMIERIIKMCITAHSRRSAEVRASASQHRIVSAASGEEDGPWSYSPDALCGTDSASPCAVSLICGGDDRNKMAGFENKMALDADANVAGKTGVLCGDCRDKVALDEGIIVGCDSSITTTTTTAVCYCKCLNVSSGDTDENCGGDNDASTCLCLCCVNNICVCGDTVAVVAGNHDDLCSNFDTNSAFSSDLNHHPNEAKAAECAAVNEAEAILLNLKNDDEDKDKNSTIDKSDSSESVTIDLSNIKSMKYPADESQKSKNQQNSVNSRCRHNKCGSCKGIKRSCSCTGPTTCGGGCCSANGWDKSQDSGNNKSYSYDNFSVDTTDGKKYTCENRTNLNSVNSRYVKCSDSGTGKYDTSNDIHGGSNHKYDKLSDGRGENKWCSDRSHDKSSDSAGNKNVVTRLSESRGDQENLDSNNTNDTRSKKYVVTNHHTDKDVRLYSATCPTSNGFATRCSKCMRVLSSPTITLSRGSTSGHKKPTAAGHDVDLILASQQQAIRASFGHQQKPPPGGHSHQAVDYHPGETSVIRTVAWMIIFGDGFHNFLDGVSIGAAFSKSKMTGISISLAVLCEELPHELGDFAVLLSAGMSMRQALMYNFLSATTCYAGLVLGILLGEFTQDSTYIFALAAGMFLYISCVDMLPELNDVINTACEKSSTKEVLWLLLLQNAGLFLGVASLFILAYYQDDIALG